MNLSQRTKTKEGIKQYLDIFNLTLDDEIKESDKFSVNYDILMNDEEVGQARIYYAGSGEIFVKNQEFQMKAIYRVTNYQNDILAFIIEKDNKETYAGEFEVYEDPINRCNIGICKPKINVYASDKDLAQLFFQEQERIFKFSMNKDEETKVIEEFKVDSTNKEIYHTTSSTRNDSIISLSRPINSCNGKIKLYRKSSLNNKGISSDLPKNQNQNLETINKEYYESINWLKEQLRIGEVEVFDRIIRIIFNNYPKEVISSIFGYDSSSKNYQEESKIKQKKI